MCLSAGSVNDAVYRFIESGGFDVMQLCYNLVYQCPTWPFGSLEVGQKFRVGGRLGQPSLR